MSDVAVPENLPSLEDVPVQKFRFSFEGKIIPPKEGAGLPSSSYLSNNKTTEIPVSMGLHHHGEDAWSAGYTITELTTLCRSTVQGQRSIALQIFAKILDKCRKKEYPKGLLYFFTCVHFQKVLKLLRSFAILFLFFFFSFFRLSLRAALLLLQLAMLQKREWSLLNPLQCLQTMNNEEVEIKST